MANINPDTILLVQAADSQNGCTAQRLREAFAGQAQRSQKINQIRTLVRTYARLAAISAPEVVSRNREPEPAGV